MKKIWERVSSLATIDRDWDIKFWQAQNPDVRFNAAWQMLEDFYKIRGKRLHAKTLRLQRSVENLKQA
jgi:hypothetical protein